MSWQVTGSPQVFKSVLIGKESNQFHSLLATSSATLSLCQGKKTEKGRWNKQKTTTLRVLPCDFHFIDVLQAPAVETGLIYSYLSYFL